MCEEIGAIEIELDEDPTTDFTGSKKRLMRIVNADDTVGLTSDIIAQIAAGYIRWADIKHQVLTIADGRVRLTYSLHWDPEKKMVIGYRV